jgi:hypothetical protein
VVSRDTGLPDGTFASSKYQFGYIVEGLGIVNVSIFCSHLACFIAFLWQFSIVSI